MKKLWWITALLATGCIEAAPEAASSDPQEEPEELYDCSDCLFGGFAFGNSTVVGSLPNRARCKAPGDPAPFAFALGVWSRNGEIAAGGIRCVDVTASWESDAFAILPGNNIRDLVVIGDPPFMMEADESRCTEGLLSGIEYKFRGDSPVALKVLCGQYRVETSEESGNLTSVLRRVGIEPGDYVPAIECDDCETRQEICPEGSIAEGFQTKIEDLPEGGAMFTGFDVVCVPITAQITRP